MDRLTLSVAVLVFCMSTPARAQLSGGGGGQAPSPRLPVAAAPPDPILTSNAAVNAGNAAYARRDFVTAASQFALACDAGNASACGALGDMYVKGEGVRPSGARAAGLLARACDAGITVSCGKLGVLYDSGNGVALNKARAFTLFNAACARSDMTSCYNQGQLYETGQGTTPNVAQAASLYQRACTAGVADGCSGVGALYSKGVHFAQNDSQAAIYFDLACSRGSQTGCARSSEVKTAMTRNIELKTARAAASFRARATHSPNCAKANTLAEINLVEAERFARMGLHLNDPACIHVLGYVSERKGDYELAYAYYINAANKNFMASIHNIGGLYSNGYYLQRNMAVGSEWYRRALRLAEAAGNTSLAALARENIANNDEAMNSPPISDPRPDPRDWQDCMIRNMTRAVEKSC